MTIEANKDVAPTPPRDASTSGVPPPNASDHAGSAQPEPRGMQLGPAIDDAENNGPNRKPANDLDQQVQDVKGSAKAPKTAGGRVVVASHRALDQSTLSSPRMVTEFLRRNLPSVKKCYGSLLAASPSAHGEMKLRFAVSETGTVVDGTADSWSSELSSCVRDGMSKWTFPIPQANGNPTRSRFELDLDMKSE